MLSRVGVRLVCASATTSWSWCWWEHKRKACPRWDVPLGVRYRGTKVDRSARARQLMSDAEVSSVAQLINNLVDLEFYGEDEEQEIFEFSVCHLVEQLATSLPNEVIFQVHSEKEMSKEHAKHFECQLRKWLYQRCDLPFLNAQDQRRIVRCVLVLLMRSMRKPKSEVGELTDVEKNKLIFDVFVKGAIEVFYEEATKQEIIERVEAYASNIPFLHFLMGPCVELLLSRAGDSVTPVLSDSYYEFLWNWENQRLTEEEHDLAPRPFTTLLRHNLCAAFIKNGLENSEGILRFASFLPTADLQRYVLLFVDSFLDAIDARKLDEIMVLVARDDALRRSLIKDNLRHGHDPTCIHTTTAVRSIFSDDAIS
ncbi:hypothetical protein CTAYLR_005945 [Chrysophaeum taylorii]|uniref:Uncharacterized protein n=1 Tax=Chrysophaeum taylorii TaxID=2483200 RepID=A0AAD7UB02_9STRA|nr:hypothetical protein CTAYLR_005945 [Chrysophaeum taylorii]